MNRVVSLIFIAWWGIILSAQTRLRDMWVAMPNEIVPLLTENNRLDMIDFVENNMEAKVRNIFEGWSTMDTLTDNYLRCSITPHSDIQMRLLPAGDTVCVVAVVNTSRTPEAVSTIRFYNMDWTDADVTFTMPAVELFADSCDVQALKELADLPLVKMELSATRDAAVCCISTATLARETRKRLENKLHTITLYWNEKTRSFVTDSAVQ